MRKPILAALALVPLLVCNFAAAQTAPQSAPIVIVNGQRLIAQEVHALEQSYRVRVRAGRYWYDRLTGAWGFWGGPTAGVMRAGHNLGGPLAETASNGNTGVFINGRQLHQRDVWLLMQIMPVRPGRYWMNASGTFGYEGRLPLGNIWQFANAARSRGTVRREGILSSYDKTGLAVFGY
jgi:hypothetical protein